MLQAAARMDDEPNVIGEYLAAQEQKSLLRFLTCGSVDDGKSTLIGRLLYDTKLLFDDQIAALERDSKKHGTNGDDIDFALLVDGLEAEREQGITIDVAYRFFATDKRKFIVADTPGHEQYTRNMATGASTADVAVVLIDARQGVLPQTRRHTVIASLLGIRRIVVAINKIDLVHYDRAAFEKIVADYMAFAGQLAFEGIVPIPMSARHGDNVTRRSDNMAWYKGPTLLQHLETVPVGEDASAGPFRFPVQYVTRPNLDFRGFAGTVASGSIAAGEAVVVAKSGRTSHVKRIVTQDGDLDRAVAGQAVTLVLEDEVEVSRGNMLVAPEARPLVADRFAANLVWFDESALVPGRAYLLRTETDQVNVTVPELRHRLNVTELTPEPAASLAMNEVGAVTLFAQQPVVFDPFAQNPATGAFILIDRISNATVAAGMITGALRSAADIHWQALDVDREARAVMKNQTPRVLWFTGLSGSGKSTIANLLEKKLHAAGRHTFLLDGDNVRHGLNRDLGFSDADRAENIRRVAEVAKLMTEAGLIVLVSFISPFRAERDLARGLFAEGEFVEVFVDTPLDECQRRDPKGLYAKVASGTLKNFTGIDSPYEPPEAPEIRLVTLGKSPEEMIGALEDWLRERDGGTQQYDSGGGI
ncbi:MAG: sulfate adenylyltransferase subunit CysN [Rhizobiaceae bacterium]